MAAAKKQGEPSELELQILGVLWQKGSCNVRTILESLTDKKQRGYTAVLSVVQSMERKNLVKSKRIRGERAFQYTAKRSRESIVGPLLGGLVDRVFGGDPALAVQQLLDASDLQEDTIDRLKVILANAAAKTDNDESTGGNKSTTKGSPS